MHPQFLTARRMGSSRGSSPLHSPARSLINPLARLGLLLFLAIGKIQAHDVVWWEDPDAPASSKGMDFYFPMEDHDTFGVVPSSDELCTVVVNLNPPDSTLIAAQVLPPNPGNEVDIFVRVLREPVGASETATLTGEWHATGLPKDSGCTAVMPNLFTVPIVVKRSIPLWHVSPKAAGRLIDIDTGLDCALRAAESPLGPWLTVGKGKAFTINSDETPFSLFTRLRRVGGLVSGTVSDPLGKALSGATLGLLYGGASTTTDASGGFSLPRLPWGLNLITISNWIGASLNVVIPATNNTAVNFKVAMEAQVTPPTNACNCTPWCAIGFGALPGGQTPVYFAGGANPPAVGPADCGKPSVTVTTPSGAKFPIIPGSSRHQNSGEEPEPGTWTVTTVVCGQTKSCSVTVP